MMTYPEMGEKFTRKILKLLFNKEFRNLKVIAQKSYEGLNTDLRGARLDVYVERDDSDEIDASEDVSIYDLEPDKNDLEQVFIQQSLKNRQENGRTVLAFVIILRIIM